MNRADQSGGLPVKTAKATNASLAGARARLIAAMRSGETNVLYTQFLDWWQAPIEFYGKVVDQESDPVAGVHVHFSWNELPNQDGMRSADTESGLDGLFALHNKFGQTLEITLGKDGYYSSHNDPRAFNYGREYEITSADWQNPVIFHLRKKGGAVPLIQTHFPVGMGQRVRLHNDGTPTELSLLSAQETPEGSGQLRLEFWQDNSNKRAVTFNWKLRVSVPGGGLLPTDQEFAFEAPDSGYTSDAVVDMPASATNWTDDFRAKYYVHLSDGNFACVDIYLLADNGIFTVHSVINPTGSRNLEPAN